MKVLKPEINYEKIACLLNTHDNNTLVLYHRCGYSLVVASHELKIICTKCIYCIDTYWIFITHDFITYNVKQKC